MTFKQFATKMDMGYDEIAPGNEEQFEEMEDDQLFHCDGLECWIEQGFLSRELTKVDPTGSFSF
jgi:hypothetical protein